MCEERRLSPICSQHLLSVMSICLYSNAGEGGGRKKAFHKSWGKGNDVGTAARPSSEED